MTKPAHRLSSVPADPSHWSEKSQHSISAHYVKEYKDIEYNCRRCKRAAVFSAEDQRYTYEVKKASIDQRRVLCPDCWKESLVVDRDISLCEQQWAASKNLLKRDAGFLQKWLQLLVTRESYVLYRPNTAAKNMLHKMLRALPN